MADENIENKDKQKKPAKSKSAGAKREAKGEKPELKKTVKPKASGETKSAGAVSAGAVVERAVSAGTAKAKKADAVVSKIPEIKQEKAKEEKVEKVEVKQEKIKEKAEVKEEKEEKVKEKIEVKEEKKAKGEGKKQAAPKAPVAKHLSRLKQYYDSEVVKALKALYKYSTPMAVPRVVKVIINIGMGEATQDKSVVDAAVEELTTIAAQKAVKTFAKKSISNFHLREGMPIGARVTLRGVRMFDFIDKLISVALPRVRDFKGLSSSSFDGRGNYTIGLKEQLVFPEINYDKITKIRGMDVTIVTTAANDDEAYQLLKTLGFPFKEK